MAGSFDATTIRHVSISGADAVMEYPSTGWTVFGMVFPDSGITQSTFGYAFSHGEPAAFNQSVNVLRDNGLGGALRALVYIDSGLIADIQSNGNLVNDQWNAFALVWRSANSNLELWLNGAVTAMLLAPFGTVTPTVDARIGNATFDPATARMWGGRICHPAKYNREFTTDEAEKYTSIFVSPQFAQNSAQWHIEMFRGGNVLFDLVGNTTLAETSMDWGPHAPVDLPSDHHENLGLSDELPLNILQPAQFTFA